MTKTMNEVEARLAAARRVAEAIPSVLKVLAHSSVVELGHDGRDIMLLRCVTPDAPVPEGWHVLYPPPALPKGTQANVRLSFFDPGNAPFHRRRAPPPAPLVGIEANGFVFRMHASIDLLPDEGVRWIDVEVVAVGADGDARALIVCDAEMTPPDEAAISDERLPEQGRVEEERLLDPWALGIVRLDAQRP